MGGNPTGSSQQHDEKASSRRAMACLSLDFELAWGVHGETGWREYCQRFDYAEATLARVCAMLDAHNVAATWATVGAIMLDGPDDAVFASDVGIASVPKEYRATHDPRVQASREGPPSHWYRPDLIRLLKACRTTQDIGCHSFTHQTFGADTPTAVVRDQLARAKLAAAKHGLELRSLVFPCNIEGHHDVVREAGFLCYRGGGAGSSIFAQGGDGAVGRGLRLVDQALGMTPKPVYPQYEVSFGLWNIPASAFLMPLSGLRGLGGERARRRKIDAGIEAVMRDGGLFHLWTHPHNLMADSDRMLGLLESALEVMSKRRASGDLLVDSMRGLAAMLERERIAGGAA